MLIRRSIGGPGGRSGDLAKSQARNMPAASNRSMAIAICPTTNKFRPMRRGRPATASPPAFKAPAGTAGGL